MKDWWHLQVIQDGHFISVYILPLTISEAIAQLMVQQRVSQSFVKKRGRIAAQTPKRWLVKTLSDDCDRFVTRAKYLFICILWMKLTGQVTAYYTVTFYPL